MLDVEVLVLDVEVLVLDIEILALDVEVLALDVEVLVLDLVQHLTLPLNLVLTTLPKSYQTQTTQALMPALLIYTNILVPFS